MWVVKGVIAWGGGLSTRQDSRALSRSLSGMASGRPLCPPVFLVSAPGALGMGRAGCQSRRLQCFVLGCVGDNGQVSGDVVGRVALHSLVVVVIAAISAHLC